MVNETTTLKDVLQKFGQPDEVRMTVVYDLYLTLIYKHMNVVVYLYAARLDCMNKTITTDYEAHYLEYWRAEVFEKEARLNELLLIPDEVWYAWLSSEDDGLCIEALGQTYRMADAATQTAVASPRLTATPFTTFQSENP